MAGFDDIIGQELIKEHLKNSIATGQINHAYIINGERGSGKEFVAKIFARALECEEDGVEPCEQCHSCMQALSGNHPDIKVLIHEKPNTISVEDIRTQINSDVQIKPYGDGYKIYIINDAEKMNVQAQNALLKTLEEPPKYVVILLLTTNEQMLLPTIRSRCVSLNMKPVENQQLRKYLMEKQKIVDYQADICIAFARGNLGRAKMLAASEDFDNIKREAVAVLKNIKAMEVDEIVTAIKGFSEFKLSISDFFDILTIWYRDVLMYKATQDAGDLTFKDEFTNIRKQANECSYEGIEKIINAIDTAGKRINANVNFELTLELMLLAIKENS